MIVATGWELERIVYRGDVNRGKESWVTDYGSDAEGDTAGCRRYNYKNTTFTNLKRDYDTTAMAMLVNPSPIISIIITRQSFLYTRTPSQASSRYPSPCPTLAALLLRFKLPRLPTFLTACVAKSPSSGFLRLTS